MLVALTIQAAPAAADPDTCGYQVGGDILAKYNEYHGREGVLGCPTSDELTTPDGRGRYNTFDGGSIYWTPETGAHPVWGAIRDKWAQEGWEAGRLGYPKTDELTNPDGEGKRQEFENGTYYWNPFSNGAHAVSGKIGWVWGNYKWEAGDFGYPTSDRSWDSDNKEWVQKFSNHRSIFWNPEGNDIEGCRHECVGYFGVVPDDPESRATDLINETRIEIPMSDWQNTFVVRAWPTLKGRTGGKVLAPAEWDQAWQRVPKPWAWTDAKESSIYKQFVCHVAFSAPKPGGGWTGGESWDLESWRSDLSWLKVMNPLLNDKCNWD
ncbi:DUF2599 domain-containing protein [Streptomyces antnestii]|uniref:DUF2599 domain-containing protein n=1 Tax=Streptomyces antnestii TaxID=2494256 RepID=UPI001CB91BB2|nr:DUF2599 domain-containing protein [Streptomyces sp. San01]